jgi:hypothetical protein
MAVLYIVWGHIELYFLASGYVVAFCLGGEPLDTFVLISNYFLKIDFDSKMGKDKRDIYKNCQAVMVTSLW